MTFLLFAIALCFPLLQGVLLIRLLEGYAPVLQRFERLCWGFLLGSVLGAYLLFWLMVFGMPLTFGGFFIIHVLLIGILGVLCRRRFRQFRLPTSPSFPIALRERLRSLPWWGSLLLAWIIVWTVVKIVIGGYDLFISPSYYNDTYASWNMRAKVFYEEKSLLLDRETSDPLYFGGRVPSYPLTIYFTKLWPTLMVGEWKEPVVNGVHIIWFLVLLGAVFSALRRETSPLWSIVGTYVLVSLPLILVHGTSAYVDVLMAAHLFITVYALYRYLMSSERSWLLLFAVATAAMLFVKNEALLIFLPPLILLFLWQCFGNTKIRKYENTKNNRQFAHLRIYVFSHLFMWLSIVSIVLVPWTLFKIVHGLTFGNASKVGGMSLSPNPDVLGAIEGDLLYTGNYLLFFPLFALLLLLGWRFWNPLKSALGVIVLFLLIVFVGEICIYWLTPLAHEAIRHTGFGRGMVHLLPLGVFSGILILRSLFEK